jgi:hypothetical protein
LGTILKTATVTSVVTRVVIRAVSSVAWFIRACVLFLHAAVFVVTTVIKAAAISIGVAIARNRTSSSKFGAL